ncbi:hypothetical protein JOD57_004117 [Geodermatophilus bullaregiensis]|uniref:hypothetical protein n=1 Tax=Geodermatophilus bullaregiensis TaxID=1564160 RepID=UPI001957A55A|nr:hypothetical protein [Geodermatophilus bullaregiensis]MBM7808280.1 hypothetical protein [Geodermatophilus bullaregiensis]
MPPARRAAAVLAALLVTGCTSGSPEPAPPRPFTEVLGTVDLDAVAPGGVDVLDLAPTEDGGALALLAGTDDPAVGYLASVTAEGLGDVRRIDGVGTQLFLTPDGTALAAGPDRLTAVRSDRSAVTGLGVTVTTAALSPDGRRLYAATEKGTLASVDVATGDVLTETDLDEGLTVHTLAVRDDGGPTALLSDARAPDLADVAVLAGWDAQLERMTGPVELAPDRPASIPSALRLADDGTAVAVLTAGSGDDPFRVVVVAGGEVTASHAVPGTDRVPADLAVTPDGRAAHLPVAGFEVESGVITLDLASGEQVGDVRLCEGQATFGRVALAGDRLTVIGSCITSDAPSSTAFVVG